MNDIERVLAALAANQHQVFSRTQAREAGMSARAIARREANGRFVVVGPEARTFGGVTLDWCGQLHAGLLDLGDGAIVSAESAAALHRLDGYGEGPLVFLAPRSARRRTTVGTVVTTSSIGSRDVVTIGGLPVTSGTRTVIELLGRVDQERLGNAYDSACRKRITSPEAIDRRLTELGRQGRKGVADLDAIRRIGHVESWLERRFLRLVRSHGLPMPAVQRVYRRDGIHIARVDFDFAPLPLLVEVAGSRGYLSRDERRRQERRRNDLQLLGKVVYFFTYADVVHEPRYVVATIGAAIEAA